MPATFTGPLARRLDGISRLDVQEVRDPVALKPGNVYIGRGDADVIIIEEAGSSSGRGHGRARLEATTTHGTPAPTDWSAPL